MGQTLVVVVENKLLFWAIAFILRKRQLLTKAKQRKVKTHMHVEYFWNLSNPWLLAQPKFICAEHTVFQRFMLVSSSRIPGIFPRLTSLSAKVISKLYLLSISFTLPDVIFSSGGCWWYFGEVRRELKSCYDCFVSTTLMVFIVHMVIFFN